MQKIFKTIMNWLKRLVYNKALISNNNLSPKNSFSLSSEDVFKEHLHPSSKVAKKAILKEFNTSKKKSHDGMPEILNETIRNNKPDYSNSPNILFRHNGHDYNVTKKQFFFLENMLNQTLKSLQNEERLVSEIWYDIDMDMVCSDFMKEKCKNTMCDFNTLSKEKLKPKYHKKTIKFLEKVGLITKSATRNKYVFHLKIK